MFIFLKHGKTYNFKGQKKNEILWVFFFFLTALNLVESSEVKVKGLYNLRDLLLSRGHKFFVVRV